MALTSTMFLNNVTSVDHAYIGSDGWVHGNSYSPIFKVTGKIDEHENVVVDFSAVKKDIKAIIDDKLEGLDHKLWIIDGYSNATVTKQKNNGKIIVETPLFKYVGSADSVRWVDADDVRNFDTEVMRAATSGYVLSGLCNKYPEVEISINTGIDMRPTTTFQVVPFHYTHGLKNSTSWGCQNMMHGHKSYLHFVREKGDRQDWATNDYKTDILEHEIAGALDGKMFVWSDNWFEKTNTLEYFSQTRGEFVLQLKEDRLRKRLVVLPTETTIEHITAYVADRWSAELNERGVTEVYVSEGQNKGAVVAL